MSGVIKSAAGRAGNIRPVALGARTQDQAAPREPRVSPELLAAREQLRVLAEESARKDAEIERLTQAARQARIDGEAEGRRQGLAEAEDRSAEMLRDLKAGVTGAAGAFAANLGAMERLAVSVAHESLARMIGDPAGRAELLRAAIRHQFAAIEGRSIVRVEVAAADFPDAEALAELGASFGPQAVAVVALPDLTAGDCHIRLTLGGVEVGLNQQWGKLSGLLATLAAPGAPG